MCLFQVLSQPFPAGFPKLGHPFFRSQPPELIHAAVFAFRIIFPVPAEHFCPGTEHCAENHAVEAVREEHIRVPDRRKECLRPRAVKQFEMQAAVQAAMRGRAALLGSPDEPEIRSVEAARAAAKEEKPVIKIGGKSMEEFLAEHPTVVVSNLNGRLLAPAPMPVRPAENASEKPAEATSPSK